MNKLNNKNIKIVIFSQSLESGGAEKQAVMLANLLSKLFSVQLIVFYGNKTSERITSQINVNVNLILLQGNKLKKIINLYKILKESSPYILFNYLLYPNLLGGFLSEFLSNSISVGSIRSAILDKNKILFNRFAHNNLNKKTIFNNYSGYERYTSQGFKKGKAFVIPNAIDLTKKEITRPKKSIPNILSVGRFEKVKDYYTALKSIKGLLDSGVELTYTIIGWGSLEKQIYHWITELEIPNEIVKIVINPPQIEKYYIDADIYLQTSLFEGLSNTVLEAMSFSLPLIVTDVGDNNRLVHNDNNGFIVTPKDSSSIEKHLKLLLSDYNTRIIYGKISYEIVKSNYSIEAMKNKYLELINQFAND